jgi:tetratricopeptide (TPR) repeat protein
MKQLSQHVIRRLALGLLILVGPLALKAQIPVEMTREFWRDPGFVERFIGTYATLTSAEPRINDDERPILGELGVLIQEDPPAALVLLNETINPSSSATLIFVRGNLYFQSDQLAAAARDYKEAIKRFPEFLRAHKNLGLIQLQEQEFEAATASLGRAIELGDSEGRSFGLLGYAYFNLQKYIAAENSYRQALMLDPKNKDWTLGLAQSLMALESFSSAGSLMEGMLKENPDNKDHWLFLVNVNLNLERPQKAAEILEILRIRGQASTDNLELLGNIYLNREDFGLALEVYQEMLSRSDALPDSNVPINVASILTRYGATEESKDLLGRIESTYGEALERDERLRVWNIQAQIARAEYDNERAATLLDQILEEDPSNGGALLEMAGYHSDDGNLERAYLMLDRAERLPDFEAAALRLRGQLLVREGKYDEAVDALDLALSLNPDDRRLADYLEQVQRAADIGN